MQSPFPVTVKKFTVLLCQPVRRKQLIGQARNDQGIQFGFRHGGGPPASGRSFETISGASVVPVTVAPFACSGPNHQRPTAALTADKAGQQNIAVANAGGRDCRSAGMQALLDKLELGGSDYLRDRYRTTMLGFALSEAPK